MPRRRPRRPSPSMAVALLALFAALGGTGYAALKLPKNSVGAKQLRNNSVRSSKVKNRSLVARDFKQASCPRGRAGRRGRRAAARSPRCGRARRFAAHGASTATPQPSPPLRTP